MDKGQLVTIVVTAIISAFAREIVSGLFSLVKKLSAKSTLTAKLRQVFTFDTINILLEIMVLLSNCWQLYERVSDPSPVTRQAVFHISFWTLMVGFWSWNLIADVVRYIERRDKIKQMSVVNELPAVGEERQTSEANRENASARVT